MTVKDQDVELVQGEAVEISWPLTRQADGSLPNLDGATATYAARVFATAEVMLSKAATVGTVTNAKGDTVPGVRVIVESDDTADLEGNWYHELRITDVAGRTFVPARGALIVRRAPR